MTQRAEVSPVFWQSIPYIDNTFREESDLTRLPTDFLGPFYGAI